MISGYRFVNFHGDILLVRGNLHGNRISSNLGVGMFNGRAYKP